MLSFEATVTNLLTSERSEAVSPCNVYTVVALAEAV